MMRPGRRAAHISLAGWIALIAIAWAGLWLCSEFWPGWWQYDFYL